MIFLLFFSQKMSCLSLLKVEIIGKLKSKQPGINAVLEKWRSLILDKLW